MYNYLLGKILIEKGILSFSILFTLLILLLSIESLSQCPDNILLNGAMNGEISFSSDAVGWTGLCGDPDLVSVDYNFPGNVKWSQNLVESNNGGTWQNLSTISEKIQQEVILQIGQRYFIELEYVSQGLIRNDTMPLFQELTGVKISIGEDIILETPVDTTAYTWESICLSFIATQEINMITLEGTVLSGYLGIDGICLYEDIQQVVIPDSVLCIGELLVIELAEDSLRTVTWQGGQELDKYEITASGEYQVEISDACGTYQESFEVLQEDCGCKLYIPDVFSPNSAGIDRYFNIGSHCLPSSYMLDIYDRWGNLIFRSTSIEESWDGTYMGSQVLEGVYIYKLDYNFLNEEKAAWGSITVLN